MKTNLLFVLSILFATLGTLRGASDGGRPNVLIFITDDESWQERSAYGWSNVPTPTFDRVAKQGVLFTRCFASAPSCAPARASLLTGRNFWELEQGAFIQAWLPAKFPVLPDLMAAGGYHAGYTGKGWGPGVSPPESGRTRNPAGPAYNAKKRAARSEGISDIDYAANFAAFLDQRPRGAPFLFWVGCQEPHSPCAHDNYKRLRQEYGIDLDAVKVPAFLPNTTGVRRSRANMLYELCHADADLGRVLKVLEDRGELANTLVIVTGDNGTAVLRGKTNLYDWGVRVPLAMMWPNRIKPGRRVDDFINFADFAPTILEAAGLFVPREMSGRSALDVLVADRSGRIDPARNWTAAGLEWHGEAAPVNLAGRMIRDEQFLYIVNYGAGPRLRFAATSRRDSEYAQAAETGDEFSLIANHPEHPAVKRFYALGAAPRPHEELYDCEADPWQIKNLADLPEWADMKARLKAQLEAYQRQTGDPRITGEMTIFNQTREFVLRRKFGPGGYGER